MAVDADWVNAPILHRGGRYRVGDVRAWRYARAEVMQGDNLDEALFHAGGSPSRQRSAPNAHRLSGGRTELASVIAEMHAAGVTSLHTIASPLNKRGIPTMAGSGRWYHTQVGRLLARLARRPAP
jgi:hypothetical protein